MPPELFRNCAAFVDGDPGTAGFSEPHPSEHFRWIDDRAVCFCPRPGDGSLAEPCLVVRAIGFEGGRPSYLSVSVDRRHVGTQLIPGYGSYFFPLRDGLPRSAGDALENRARRARFTGAKGRRRADIWGASSPAVDFGRTLASSTSGPGSAGRPCSSPAVARSGLRILLCDVKTGFTLEGAERSPDLPRLRETYSLEDLTTFHLLYYLEKPRVP
jgi:hypothetical protein